MYVDVIDDVNLVVLKYAELCSVIQNAFSI